MPEILTCELIHAPRQRPPSAIASRCGNPDAITRCDNIDQCLGLFGIVVDPRDAACEIQTHKGDQGTTKKVWGLCLRDPSWPWWFRISQDAPLASPLLLDAGGGNRICYCLLYL